MLVCARALAEDRAREGRLAVSGAGRALSHAQLRNRAARIAERSSAWGGRSGDAYVAVIADWTPEFVACFLGLASAGRAVGVIDPAWSDTEVRGALDQLDPGAVLVADEHAGRLDAIAGTGRGHAVDGEAGWTVLTTGDRVAPHAPPPVTADAPFYVGFTSGSSGRPKAFVRTHRSWWQSFMGFDRLCPLDPGGAVLVPGPLSSSHFLFGALHALHAGATVEIVDPATLPRRLADGDRPSALYVVPTLLAGICAGEPAGDGGPGYIFCAGARLEATVAEAAARRFPAARLVEYYGASELSFVAMREHGDRTPAGSVGPAFPGVEVSIRDEDDRPVPAGREGTIFVRSDLVFAGYRGHPPAGGARRLDGGWWTVGDRGMLDADGNLFISGRGSSLIITGGANVQPEEVEDAVARCPGVAACAVVGVPDPRWGEIVCAAVVAQRDASLRRDQLRAGLAGVLAPYKRPRRYVLLDGPLPVGRSGKVDRPRVRELVLAAGDDREIR